jgi:hypothetical protein
LSTDFQAAASLLNAGSFATLINRAGLTQFCLRFARDDNADNSSDYLAFYSGNFGTVSYRPSLVVKYYLP